MPFVTYYKSMRNYNPYANAEERQRMIMQTRGRKTTIVVDLNNIDYTKVERFTAHGWHYAHAKRAYAQKYGTDTIAYTVFTIPKRSGGVRTIEATNEYGKALQRTALHILRDECKILEHDAAYGFVTKRNCKQALMRHKENESKYFLKMDIDNFFPSLTRDMVVNACAATAQCARYRTEVARMLDDCAFYNGRLSQGSPLSPYLANIVMLKFDILLSTYAEDHSLVYTRYADDILISSAEPIKVAKTITKVKECLRTVGTELKLKDSKTRYGTYKGRNWNLGIMYNKDMDITVGHEAKHNLKIIAHNWESVPEQDKPRFVGLLSYYKSIEPDYFSQERFNVIRL